MTIDIGNVIMHETPRDYKQAQAYTLAQDYGFTRIMSSYYFTNSDEGPPNNGGYRYILLCWLYFCIIITRTFFP